VCFTLLLGSTHLCADDGNVEDGHHARDGPGGGRGSSKRISMAAAWGARDGETRSSFLWQNGAMLATGGTTHL
jgi:hypothetical protein